MKPLGIFFIGSGLLLIAFVLYVTAPAVRGLLIPHQSQIVPAPAPQVIPPQISPPQTPIVIVKTIHEKPASIQEAPPTTNLEPNEIPAKQSPINESVIQAASVQQHPPQPIDYEEIKERGGDQVMTFPINAGQKLEIAHPYFNFIEVLSDFPVTFQVGYCRFVAIQRATCDSVSPEDMIQVQDLRTPNPEQMQQSDYAPQNRIRITAMHD
jgi:hypothetical protein